MKYKEKAIEEKCFADMKNKCFALVKKNCKDCPFYKERAKTKKEYMKYQYIAKHCNISYEIDKYFRSL